jgi:hypothetical protein
MGRIISSWRIIFDQEFAKLNKFKQFLRAKDQIAFEDLLNECKLCVIRWSLRFIGKGNSHHCA